MLQIFWILLTFLVLFFFKESHIFIEEQNKPLEIVVIVKEELDDIDVDDTSNFEALLTLAFIEENVGILKKSLMAEILLETLTNSKSHTFDKRINVYSVKNAIGESIS